MRYQSTGARLAPSPTRGIFRAAVAHAAGVALEVPGLTASQRQLLHDLRREEGRYQFRALDDLLDILTLVTDERQSVAFCDNLRAAITARRRRKIARGLREAVVAELEADAATFPAVTRAALDRTPATLSTAIVACERQRSALDELLDAMRVERFALIHGGAR